MRSSSSAESATRSTRRRSPPPRVLATASRAEGFGLPVVEAMVAGTPVAISDIPIFREIAGEDAVYSPRTLPRMPPARSAPSATTGSGPSAPPRASKRAPRYDWRIAGEQLLAFLLEVAGTRRR